MEKCQTELLLERAQDIARRFFEEPTDAAVMQIFQRVCVEHDMAQELRLGASCH